MQFYFPQCLKRPLWLGRDISIVLNYSLASLKYLKRKRAMCYVYIYLGYIKIFEGFLQLQIKNTCYFKTQKNNYRYFLKKYLNTTKYKYLSI